MLGTINNTGENFARILIKNFVTIERQTYSVFLKKVFWELQAERLILS